MRKSLIVLVVVTMMIGWWGIDQRLEAAPHSPRVVKHKPMEDISHERIVAYATLNEIRATMGMVPMQENTALVKAAQAHADYLVRHHLTSHSEKAGQGGFTGSSPKDRALRAGYGAQFVGENLSTKNESAEDSIRGLFSAIYHRFGFLNSAFDEVGIGIAQDQHDARNSAFVYLMGNSEMNRLCHQKGYHGVGRYVYGVCANTQHRIEARAYDRARNEIKENNPKIIRYPYAGQTDVPPAFYQETPDPLPDYDVSGFPISIVFNDRYFRKVSLVSFRLYEEGGGEVTQVRLLDKHNDPNHEMTRRQFALMPLKRLQYGKTYHAEVVYRHNKKTQTLRWTFSTVMPTERLITIRERSATIHLKRGQGYWLYFAPKNPHDLLGTMRYPGNVYVRFVDNNTMRVVLDPEASRDFEISGSGRKVHIVVD